MASHKSIRRLLLSGRQASYFSLSLAGIVFIALMAGCPDGGAPPPEITSSSPLPGATVGQEYEVTLEARHGQPPLTWSGSPPADLRLEPDSGRMTGKPGAEGSFPFEVTVKDSAGRSNTKSFELSITPDVPLAITTTSPLLSAVVGEEGYKQQLKATRRGQLIWSSSDLADDFTLDPAQGIVTATPKRVGTFTFDVRATDEEKHCSAKRFQLTVGLYIVTRRLQDATPGRAYEARVEVKGGIPPLKWSLASGALPGGLILDEQTGEITGKPTSASATPFDFEVMVTDSAEKTAQSDTQAFQMSVVTVRMENLLFKPPAVEVKAGDTVVWKHHQGQTPHTVTSGVFAAPDAGQLFDSRDGDPKAHMREPDIFSHRFDTASTFPYHCVVHGSPDTSDPDAMNGTITVNP